jgi:molybdopterin synthase catalytic subunit
MFARLTDSEIAVETVVSRVTDPARGAVVLFLGKVRDRHAGREVSSITYTAYRPMAERVLARIAGDLEAEHGAAVAIVHRLGEIPAGQASLAIAVAAPHRAAAYGASRQALERLKREAPIWKREHYAGGDSVWREEESLAPATDG